MVDSGVVTVCREGASGEPRRFARAGSERGRRGSSSATTADATGWANAHSIFRAPERAASPCVVRREDGGQHAAVVVPITRMRIGAEMPVLALVAEARCQRHRGSGRLRRRDQNAYQHLSRHSPHSARLGLFARVSGTAVTSRQRSERVARRGAAAKNGMARGILEPVSPRDRLRPAAPFRLDLPRGGPVSSCFRIVPSKIRALG